MTTKTETKEVIYDGVVLTMCHDMVIKKIDRYDHQTGFMIIKSLHHHGIMKYGDLPRDLAELESKHGGKPKTIKFMFEKMIKINKTLEYDMQHHYESLDSEIVGFTDFITLKSHLDISKLDPRFIFMYQIKYSHLLSNKRVTLKELGDAIGVSPSRVRDIFFRNKRIIRNNVSKYFPLLKKDTLDFLKTGENEAVLSKSFIHYLLIESFMPKQRSKRYIKNLSSKI